MMLDNNFRNMSFITIKSIKDSQRPDCDRTQAPSTVKLTHSTDVFCTQMHYKQRHLHEICVINLH